MHTSTNTVIFGKFAEVSKNLLKEDIKACLELYLAQTYDKQTQSLLKPKTTGVVVLAKCRNQCKVFQEIYEGKLSREQFDDSCKLEVIDL